MGRIVFITGSNRGIGEAILNRFSKEKDITLLAHTRKPSDDFDALLDTIRSRTRNSIIPVYFDLSDSKSIKSEISNLLKTIKTIDILVNNAGMVLPNSSFLMTDINAIRESFEINFFAPAMITQLVAKSMIRNRGGAIVNLASIAAKEVSVGQFEYVTAKAALIAMTMKLAIELAPFGIRCNAVSPGLTETDMIGHMDENLRESFLKRISMRRFASPMEIANTVYFLCSEDAAYINGQNIKVDGGLGVL